MYDINLGLAPYLIVLLLAVANEGGNLLVLFSGQEPQIGAPPAPSVQNLNSDLTHHYPEASSFLPSVLSSCGFGATDAISKYHFHWI